MKYKIKDNFFICRVDTLKNDEKIFKNIRKYIIIYKNKLKIREKSYIIYRYCYFDEKIKSIINRFKKYLLKDIKAVDLIPDKKLEKNSFLISNFKNYNLIIKHFELTHENIKNSNINFKLPIYREDESKVIFFVDHDLYLLDDISSNIWRKLIKNYSIKKILEETKNESPNIEESHIEDEILKFICDMIIKNCIKIIFNHG